jgi:hypothetical protein
MLLHIRRRVGRSWANPDKSLRDAARFAPGRRCETLEVADTTAHSRLVRNEVCHAGA